MNAELNVHKTFLYASNIVLVMIKLKLTISHDDSV